MRDTELKQIRNKALYRSYINGLKSETFFSTTQAIDYARQQPAPMYFIQARTASLIIGKIEKGISLVDLSSNSRKRIWDIYDKYLEWRRGNPDSRLSRERVLEIIVDEPAPQFYISLGRAIHIVWHELNLARRAYRV